jgi:acyl-CoA thioesterase-1
MLFRSLVFPVSFVLGAASVAAPSAPVPAPVILVVGDSLSSGFGLRVSEGWVALLQRRLAERGLPHRVVNASITGDTTQSGANRLPRALELHEPAVVIIELGGNDGLRGISVEATRANLERMVRDAKRAGARVLLVGQRLPANYGSEFGARFHATFTDVARAERVALVGSLVDERIALDPEGMQADGIHPSAKSQPLMLDTVWTALAPLLQDGARGRPAAATTGRRP